MCPSDPFSIMGDLAGGSCPRCGQTLDRTRPGPYAFECPAGHRFGALRDFGGISGLPGIIPIEMTTTTPREGVLVLSRERLAAALSARLSNSTQVAEVPADSIFHLKDPDPKTGANWTLLIAEGPKRLAMRELQAQVDVDWNREEKLPEED